MNSGRDYPSAAVGFDGRIYVFGGVSSTSSVINTVECYSPTANQWTNVAPMPTARWISAAAAGSNGRLFVMGGAVALAGGALATVESYNPNTGAWSAAVSMPTARFGLAAALGLDGRIYAYGGSGTAGTALAVNEALSSFGGFSAGQAKGPAHLSAALCFNQ